MTEPVPQDDYNGKACPFACTQKDEGGYVVGHCFMECALYDYSRKKCAILSIALNIETLRLMG